MRLQLTSGRTLLAMAALLVSMGSAATSEARRVVAPSAKKLTKRAGDAPEEEPDQPVGTRAATRISYYTDDDGLVVINPIVSVTQRIFDASAITVEYDADILTAATVDVRTAATDKFEEVRHGLGLSGTHRIREMELELSGGASLSREADYASLTLGVGFAKELFEKNFTLGGGYAWVGNEVGRSKTPFDSFHDTLQIHALSASATQLLSKNTYAQFSGSFIIASGYQGSVYRYVPIFLDRDVDVATLSEESLLDGSARPLFRPPETVPRTRYRGAIVGRLNHHFPSDLFTDASYRFYADDWGISSHTVDLKLYQRLPAGLRVRLRNRFYYQLPASFYQRAYIVGAADELPEFFTIDRELGNFWYDMVGIKISLELPKTAFLEKFEIDIKADLQYTSYIDFAYLNQRTAFIIGSGVVIQL